MRKRNLTIYLLVLIFILFLSGCRRSAGNKNLSMEQLQLPKENEEIAVLYTNYGEIKIRLFDDIAPKAVENFKGLIRDGVYDNKIFFRIRKEDFIISGAPEESSIWGEEFEDEFNMKYCHIRGAVSMVNSGPDTNTNSFFIVRRNYIEDDIKEVLDELTEADGFPKEVVKAYKIIGGLPELDFEHTVFGQVFDGLKIVDNIADVETDSNFVPVEDVIIEKAKIENYHKK